MMITVTYERNRGDVVHVRCCFLSQSTSKDKIEQFRKTSREIFPELTGLMFNEPKMQSKISTVCPASFYAFKETVCSKHLLVIKLRDVLYVSAGFGITSRGQAIIQF